MLQPAKFELVPELATDGPWPGVLNPEKLRHDASR
jgi:hypothetical protein